MIAWQKAPSVGSERAMIVHFIVRIDVPAGGPSGCCAVVMKGRIARRRGTWSYCGRVVSASSARLLVLRLDDSDPPARLGDWLAAAGLTLDIVALDAGHPVPADLDAHDGLLVMGGAM